MPMAIARRGMNDFVRAGFPEPHNPIYQPNWDQTPVAALAGIDGGLEDFVDANFPEPHNPIYNSMSGVGCGAGCGCDSCGMGALSVPSWALSLPSPLNTMAGPLPVVYWIGGGVAALLVLPMLFKRGRR